ncbi:18547_t:CDS:2 [Acaulospora morrowiae]|uniref:18547_t:CDS:1 n=1 Tax=Acaulospora morrowiae TaxID=94023 RepID=A0A9N9FV48_9GLOM|nr:18547_t:CDS:2 [Acaulospora morrowiae]
MRILPLPYSRKIIYFNNVAFSKRSSSRALLCNFYRILLIHTRHSLHSYGDGNEHHKDNNNENSISFRDSNVTDSHLEGDTVNSGDHVNSEEKIPSQAGAEGHDTQPHKFEDKSRQFLDFLHVTVKGGHGGDGCVAFLREKGKLHDPPAGGNGGRGGHVIFSSSANHFSLYSIPRIVTAAAGENGKGHMRRGAAGKDTIIHIPLGTIVREIDPPSLSQILVYEEGCLLETDEKFKKKEKKEVLYKQNKIYFDLSVPDVRYIVAGGGKGGKGNPHFATNVNRSPTFASRGKEGKIRYLELEVKTIADVGLVGLPNVGKSTFLSAVSNAHPKIASYPFTTLNPFIGTVDYIDRFQLTVADIPGIMKGAHKNYGLGHSFLRHVERSKVLVYVLDLTSDEPWEDWKTLMKELEQYREGLTNSPSLIVANKADVTGKAKKNFPILQSKVYDYEHERRQTEKETNYDGKHEYEIIPVSAKYHKNIVKVASVLRKMIEEIKM